MSAVLEFDGLPSLSLQYGRALTKLSRPSFTGSMPDLRAVANGVTVDAVRLSAYRALCGLPDAKALPATYPQVLASPLHGAILAHGSFPFKPLGIVHRANRIVVLAPIDARQPLDLSARIGAWRTVERGVEFDLDTVADSDGQRLWQSTTTILVRSAKPSGPRTRQASPPHKTGDLPGRTRSTILAIPEAMGRHYAQVSGDYNPIHLHAVLARPFGFPRAIVQGMWSLARCVGEFSDDLPPAPYQLDVSFDRPILLPSRVHFTSGTTDDGLTFALKTPDGAKTYLQGTVAGTHG